MSRYISEFIGTAILVFMGVGSAVIAGKLIGNMGIAFSFGLTLMFLIYALGPVSGCHVNPAVSLGMFFSGKQELKDTIAYIIFQLLGGILGAYMVYWIATGKGDFNLAQGFAVTGFMEHSPERYSLFSGSLVEIFTTAILVFVVLATTSGRFALGHAGLAIGATLAAIHFVSLPVTNTSANIARSLGTAFLVGGWAISQLWMFAVAHIIAAVIAVAFYKIIYCE
jgi:aquaporin Z